MPFKHRPFNVQEPPPEVHYDMDALQSWYDLEQVRIDAFYDDERQRIEAYYGKRKNIINTIIVVIWSISMLLNLLALFASAALEVEYTGGPSLIIAFIMLSFYSYYHGEQRYPPMS